MDKSLRHKRAAGGMYPAVEPFDVRMLDVGDGHSVYVEQSGRADGIPVVVCHGGPGGGCSPFMRRFFDPEVFRIILFDQRGCGRSTPHACVEANTTWHLVCDMELIRETLGVEAWHVFGGSWGATLALIYAQEHPARALSLILRGVFLMTEPELDWFYGGGAGAFWPELWDSFTAPIPEEERGDLIAAYHRRLFSGDRSEEQRLARIWSGWENALAVHGGGVLGGGAPDYVRAFARLESHYFLNRGWLGEDRQILSRMDRIARIPGKIVQGRYDMICPPQTAYRLADAWPAARLEMIRDAGHTMSEPGIARALIAHMDRIAGAAGERSLS
ncbi:MAG: prolyl aminopeptidase [Rhodobacterales bacterium]|nr:MAG: prolyl aminopeptidase [Rhodobacterales bacterium]